MITLYGKVLQSGRGNKIRYVLRTEEELYASVNELVLESAPFNPDTVLDDGQWYFIRPFSSSCFSTSLIISHFDSVEVEEIKREEYQKIAFLFTVSRDSNVFCFQKVGKESVGPRKIVNLGEISEYCPTTCSVLINELPDAIYSRNDDTLYFRKISVAASFFPKLIELYKEATDDETSAFLNLEMINAVDFATNQVNKLNRKRIRAATEEWGRLDESQQKELYEYINDYYPSICTDNHFVVKDNKDLAELLFGVLQRYYQTPFGGEKRIANSVILVP